METKSRNKRSVLVRQVMGVKDISYRYEGTRWRKGTNLVVIVVPVGDGTFELRQDLEPDPMHGRTKGNVWRIG